MISLDHVLLRFLLLGLAAGLFTGLYLAARHWRPHWFGGRLRKLIWLFILCLPLLAFPWPLPVLIPADTPDWVNAARLPDPRITFPGTELIEKCNDNNHFRREPVIRSSAGADRMPEPSPVPESEAARQLPVLQNAITPWFWLLDHLAVIRLIFLAGFWITLLIRLITKLDGLRRRKRQGSPAAPPLITQTDWLRDLAAVRDLRNDYRRSMLVVMEPPGTNWLAVWRSRRGGWLPINAGDLVCIDPNRRQNLIFSALDDYRHPDLLMLLLYSLWRYLAWFTPLAWLSDGIFRQDRLLWRQVSLQRQIGKLQHPQADSGHHPVSLSRPALPSPTAQRHGKHQCGPLVARLVTGLLILSLSGLAIWQNPIRLVPDVRRAEIWQNQNIYPFGLTVEGHARGDTSSTESTHYGAMLGAGQLIGYLDESDPDQAVSGIIAIDDQGGVRWMLPLSTFIDASLDGSSDSGVQAPVGFYLNDYQILADGSYRLLGNISMPVVDTMPLIVVKITADGRFTGWHLVDNGMRDYNQPYRTNAMTHKLLMNGDLLAIDGEIHETPLSVAEYESVATMATGYTLRRLTAEGVEIGAFAPGIDTMETLALGVWSYGAVTGYRQISDVIAAPDGGFFLVIDTEIILMHIADKPVDTYFQVFSGNDQIARLSADGELLWLQEFGERETIIDVNRGVAGADGCLYLAATARYRQQQLLLPANNLFASLSRSLNISDIEGPFYPVSDAYQKAVLFAVAPDGQRLWQKELYGAHGAQATQILLQDHALSVLVSNDPYIGKAVQLIKRGLSCESVWQYDLDGRLTAFAPLPKADDYQEQGWFFIRPGYARLPD